MEKFYSLLKSLSLEVTHIVSLKILKEELVILLTPRCTGGLDVLTIWLCKIFEHQLHAMEKGAGGFRQTVYHAHHI